MGSHSQCCPSRLLRGTAEAALLVAMGELQELREGPQSKPGDVVSDDLPIGSLPAETLEAKLSADVGGTDQVPGHA